MSKRKRQKAERMAARGVSAAKIERKTGVSSRAAERFVSRAAATAAAPSTETSAPTSAQTTAPSLKEAVKTKGIGQGIRLAGEGGISGRELKIFRRDAGVSDDKLIRRLDKVNEKLKGRDKIGISINAGAVNKLIKKGVKQRAKNPFGATDFGTGRLGMTIAGMMGDPGSAGRYVKGQLVGAREAVEPRFLAGGMQIRPGGRERVKGSGKQYELPERFKPTEEVVNDGGGNNNTLDNGNDTLGGGQGQDTIQPIEPIEPVDTSQITEANPFDLASWAAGFKRARSSRQRAGRKAQGLASQKKSPFKNKFK